MPAKANLTDDELREYVAQHPDAKLAEMCRHYGWNKDRLATRLKRIGLSLPGDSGKLGGTPPGVGRERTDNKTIRIAEDPTQKPWQEPVPGELPFPRDMLEAAVKEFRGFTPEQAAKYGYLGPLAGLLKHRQDQILAWKDYSAQLKGQVSRLSSLRTSDQTRLRNLEYQLKCENEEDQKRDARVATANKQMDTSAQQLKSANDRCGELQSRVTKLETEVVEAREHRKQELETTFSPEAMQTAETIAKMHARSPILKERFHSSSAAGAAALHLLETLPTEVATYSEVINKLNSERRQYEEAAVRLSDCLDRIRLRQEFITRMEKEIASVLKGEAPSPFAGLGVFAAAAVPILFGSNPPPALLSDKQVWELIERFDRGIAVDAIAVQYRHAKLDVDSYLRKTAPVASRTAQPASTD